MTDPSIFGLTAYLMADDNPYCQLDPSLLVPSDDPYRRPARSSFWTTWCEPVPDLPARIAAAERDAKWST
jgi:hypothetical protein